MTTSQLTRTQLEKAWKFVRDGRYSDPVVVKEAKITWALVKRMRGIRARVVAKGSDPMKLCWLDVLMERPLKSE